MNILLLTDVFFPDTIGGAGRVAYHQSLELSMKGHQVHVITRNPDNKLPACESLNPCLHIHRIFTPGDDSIKLILFEIKGGLQKIKKLSRNINFHIVCIHQSLAAIGPLLSGVLKNIPAIYYFHSPWHAEFLIKSRMSGLKTGIIASIMRFIEKRVLKRTSRVIVLSRFMAGKISEIHNYPAAGITIIPGGVDLEYFHLPSGGREGMKRELALPLDKTILVTVRNLVPRMGLENLITAFGRSVLLKEKCLLLIGGRGPLEVRLKALSEKLKLKDSIKFLGYIPGEVLPRIYQAADYFILPTEQLEGFGLVILEAMACGTPVIGTPVGAIPDVIGAFDQRLIFKGTSWKDIKDKLESVIENPVSYSYKPKTVRDFVENNYSWEKVADEFEKEAMRLISP
jgi:glycosyltransferase involved in cell wall biosynthesis